MNLKKIKLINWHIFTNNTIEVDGNVLITGENASGKSTLMDAIYYVLSGGDKNHFNKAANEGGQRNLETYVRGKIGSEKNPYLRPEGDIVSYIVLEYIDKKRKHSLVLGCEIEVINYNQIKNHFFVINDYNIKDEDFIKDKKVVEYRTFKSNAKAMKYEFEELPDSMRERCKKISRDIFKLGGTNRYFALLQKAICFKPISEVSTFVNGFLLNEDNIELNSLKTEIRAYQDIHRMLIKEEEKIEVLKDFTPKAEKYIKNSNEIDFLSALKVKAKLEKISNSINRTKIDLKRLEDEYNNLKLKEDTFRANQNRLNIEIHQLKNNESYKALLTKKEQLEAAKKKLNIYKEELEEFSLLIHKEQNIIKELGFNYRLEEDYKQKDFGLLVAHFEKYSNTLKETEEKLRNDNAEIKYDINQNEKSKKGKKEELDKLLKGINNYPLDVSNLIQIAKDAIIKANPKEKNPEVRPLCEYVEINEEKWTNALEGYLNTRRFNLIFDPKYYNVVSQAYDKYKNERKVYVGGIVDIAKVPSNKVLKNSLMTKIEVKHKLARKYAEYLLGDIICVDEVKELNQYQSAITPGVMVYKNYVQKATNPNIYNVPFLGSNSRKKRIEILKEEISRIDDKISEYNKSLAKISGLITIIKNSNINKLLSDSTNYWSLIENTSNEVETLEDEIKTDEKSNGLLEITQRIENAQININVIINNLANIDNEKKNNNTEQGKQKQRLEDLLKQLENENANLLGMLEKLSNEEFGDYIKRYTSNGRLNEENINKDFESAQKYNNSVHESLISTMKKYSQYKPSLTPLIENINDYVNEYYTLINNDVVKFKNEADDARKRAELSFREDFVAKLKEKIENAQSMLDNINKNLSLHPFGNDEEIYKFHYQPTKDSEFYNYYRIIMSGKLMDSKDLFTEVLDERDNSYMIDLFNKLAMETDSQQSIAEVERYLDYRNYMNYDIKITNKYKDESYFSKINKEKSGGETQTPFYIVMASCFDELMNKDTNKVESTCQVVFDEAFNNMDESRIKSLMEFYEKLNIQLIIIVPSNRFGAIAPYMDTHVGITKINNHPYVSVVSHE